MSLEETILTPTRPYFVRAIYEWLSDNNLTPYLMVNAELKGVVVPVQHIKDGAITLNISARATHGLVIDNDWVRFSARFNGKSEDIFVPLAAVVGIFAKENGQGMFFEDSEYDAPTEIDSPEASLSTASAETPSQQQQTDKPDAQKGKGNFRLL